MLASRVSVFPAKDGRPESGARIRNRDSRQCDEWLRDGAIKPDLAGDVGWGCICRLGATSAATSGGSCPRLERVWRRRITKSVHVAVYQTCSRLGIQLQVSLNLPRWFESNEDTLNFFGSDQGLPLVYRQ